MTLFRAASGDPNGCRRPSSRLLRCMRVQRRWMLLNPVVLCTCIFVAVTALWPLTETIAPETKGNAVVIDAGSTGTRLYVYRYTYSPAQDGKPRRHLQVDVPAIATKRISPGIAAFAEQLSTKTASDEAAGEAPEEEREPLKAAQDESALSAEQFHSDAGPSKTFADYMQRLRRAAVQALQDPADQRRALVVFRGTAGMRALPEEQKQTLLKAICDNLQNWGLWYLPDKSCGVLSGHEEGVLGWLALNQLLGRMPEEMSMVRLRQQQFQKGGSGAMVEMGGASAQVVFELPLSVLESIDISTATANTPAVGGGSFLLPVKGHPDLKILRFCGKAILLFTRSYLGLGTPQECLPADIPRLVARAAHDTMPTRVLLLTTVALDWSTTSRGIKRPTEDLSMLPLPFLVEFAVFLI